jgi:putative tryptophan/tyrosine transport system substrate-binding protein
MRRREFITLLGGAAAWPLTAQAQQPEQVRRIGVLMAQTADDPDGRARVAAFLQTLHELGWIEGRNVRLDYRWGGGDVDRIRRDAAELVALAPEVILAGGGQVMGPLREATRTVPIVFTQTADPVGAGFVATLPRPGGNATGFTNFEYGVSGKWLEVLREIVPGMTRAAVFRDATNPAGTGQWGAIQAVASPLGVEISPIDVRERDEIERRSHSLRGWIKWRHDYLVERVRDPSPRTDHRACGTTPIASGLPVPLLRHKWRLDLLRA